MNRRRLLKLVTSTAATSLLGLFLHVPARAAAPRDLRFRALRHGSPVGDHSVAFRLDRERLTVATHIDIMIKVLFFTALRFKHDAEEVWQSGRLLSVKSTAADNGARLQVSGYAVGDGFRILGADGLFLAAAHLLTSNTLWDRRLVRESRLIDVQHGGEVGLVAKLLGEEQVDTPQGKVRADRHQIITPNYAGSLFYDGDGRWIKGVIEQHGEILEYALATWESRDRLAAGDRRRRRWHLGRRAPGLHARGGSARCGDRHGEPERHCILFTGHADAFTIVARRELGIRSAAELRGTRINMGSPGSGEQVSMERIMAVLGVTQKDFAEVHELSLAEQHRTLCANELDAMVYSVGHPNGLIQDVVRMCRGVLVDVSGPPIDDMLSRHPEYERSVIRGGTYLDNPVDVQTLGVRAVIVTTTRLSDTLAYAITKAVFDNFEDFRRLHPLFAMLSVDDMVDVAGRAPIRTGAARYYRERGWVP